MTVQLLTSGTLGSPLWWVIMTHSLMGRKDRCVCTSSA